MVNMLAMFGFALFIFYSFSVPSKGDHLEALEDQRALEELEKKTVNSPTIGNLIKRR